MLTTRSSVEGYMLIISQRNERPDDINYCNHDRGVGGLQF